MLKMVGHSGQISLGKKYAGKYFEMEQQPDGAILLRPKKLSPFYCRLRRSSSSSGTGPWMI